MVFDTQELEYSSMSLSSSSDEGTSSDESFPDNNLKAYDFEPVCDPRNIISFSSDDEESAIENSRIGMVHLLGMRTYGN